MHPGGRPPKKDKAATHITSMRFTEAEYQRLKAYASINGMTITDVMQQGLELVYQSKEKKKD